MTSRYFAATPREARRMGEELAKNFTEAAATIYLDELTGYMADSSPRGRMYRIPGTRGAGRNGRAGKRRRRRKGDAYGPLMSAGHYQASAPGQAPAERLKLYANAMQRTPAEKTANAFVSNVFNPTKVGRNKESLGSILEKGHLRRKKGMKKRPHWGPAMDLAAPKIAALATKTSK